MHPLPFDVPLPDSERESRDAARRHEILAVIGSGRSLPARKGTRLALRARGLLRALAAALSLHDTPRPVRTVWGYNTRRPLP